jgi:hypothetical protein
MPNDTSVRTNNVTLVATKTRYHGIRYTTEVTEYLRQRMRLNVCSSIAKLLMSVSYLHLLSSASLRRSVALQLSSYITSSRASISAPWSSSREHIPK